MNISKFTQKSVQAVQDCEKLAYEYGNQEIDQEHLLSSLLTLDDSLIKKLLVKMEIQPEYFMNRVEEALNKKVNAAYEKTVLDSDQYCLFCENIMDVNCKNCTKCSSECELYDLFVDTLAPEPDDNKPNCKYAYDL